MNRIALEVISKTEVAQHLEKCVMSRGITDIFQIVMFAAGPNTTLSRSRTSIRTLVCPEKNILELYHSRVCEQQRRIITRNQRAARHNLVPGICKVLQK